jgi:hypothetical protein
MGEDVLYTGHSDHEYQEELGSCAFSSGGLPATGVQAQTRRGLDERESGPKITTPFIQVQFLRDRGCQGQGASGQQESKTKTWPGLRRVELCESILVLSQLPIPGLSGGLWIFTVRPSHFECMYVLYRTLLPKCRNRDLRMTYCILFFCLLANEYSTVFEHINIISTCLPTLQQ